MSHNILFLDDEKSILSALRRVFMKESYATYFAATASEALSLLRQTPMSVIVSDMRMPEIDGITFFKQAIEINPDAVRILMSAYADIESVMKAVNEGHIWRYITKPWDDNDLRLAIRNGVQFFEEAMAHKELLVILEKKNKALQNMNEILEQKVHERTWEIREQSRILKMIIEVEDSQSLLHACCEVACRISRSETVYLHIPFMNKVYTFPEVQPSILALELATETLQKGLSLQKGNLLSYPLTQKGPAIAALILQTGNGSFTSENILALRDFLPVMLLALVQQKAVKEAPDLIHDISKIIEHL